MVRGAFAVVAVALAVVTAPSSAAAHGEDGVFAGTEATPGTGLEVRVRARLVYANDNEPAPGAFMVVDAVDAAGMSTAPALLTDNRDGTYQGVLALPAPGAWTVRFQSMTPNATAEVAYTALEPAGPTSPTSVATTRPPPGDPSDSDDGTGVLVPVLIGVGVVGVAAGGGILWRRSGHGTT